ncbi:MAG: biopolymer transporter ExbD [Planctomycetota bacterium]
MKLSNRQTTPKKLELSMTSMIDVVFLLLIFFIVTTTFQRPEREVPSSIVVNEKDATNELSVLEPAIIDVTLQDQQVLFQIGAVQTSDLEKIVSILKDFENKSEGAFVRPAGNVPFEAAAQAIGACKAGGFSTVSYLPLD